jgi:hypothetical protein
MAKQRIVYFAECDKELYEYSQEIKNFSKWVKDRLLLERNTGGLEAFVNRLIDAKIGQGVSEPTKKVECEIDQFI